MEKQQKGALNVGGHGVWESCLGPAGVSRKLATGGRFPPVVHRVTAWPVCCSTSPRSKEPPRVSLTQDRCVL